MKKQAKIFAALLLAAAVIFAACGAKQAEAPPQSTPAPQSEGTQNSAEPQSTSAQDVQTDAKSRWLQKDPHAQVTALEYVHLVFSYAGADDTPDEGIVQKGLDNGWYDWDEIPPTGEKDEQGIQRQIAIKIAMNAFLPKAEGDYGKWAPQIADFDELDGRYYSAVFAAYEAGVISADGEGKLNPGQNITWWQALDIMESIAGGGAPKTTENQNSGQTAPITEPVPKTADTVAGGVSENGALQLKGTQLCNAKGKPIVLHGMSSHGMQWFSEYASYGAIKTTRDYGANLFRVAMYTAENGYISNPEEIKKKVIKAVDDAISLDMYVIIDWHILHDNNPNDYVEESKAFFAEMAKRYKGVPNVIYEICNEPNGGVTWEGDIRPYAMQVIPVIRETDENAIILVGTATWSQDVDAAAKNQLEFDNIMYTCHFYSGTHGADLQRKIDEAIAAGAPIFVSEWGTSQASGDAGVHLNEAQQWLDFMAQRGISWANWSLCNKNESSAALKPGASPNGGWQTEDLTESGKFVFASF